MHCLVVQVSYHEVASQYTILRAVLHFVFDINAYDNVRFCARQLQDSLEQILLVVC